MCIPKWSRMSCRAHITEIRVVSEAEETEVWWVGEQELIWFTYFNLNVVTEIC